MPVRPVKQADQKAWLAMRRALWPQCDPMRHQSEMGEIQNSSRQMALLCSDEAGAPAGFAELSLREYVEGCVSSPVAYLEGLYVKEGFRQQGLARQLVQVAEDWARGQGCAELASDTDADNLLGQEVHEKLGFDEAQRSVIYRKDILIGT